MGARALSVNSSLIRKRKRHLNAYRILFRVSQSYVPKEFPFDVQWYGRVFGALSSRTVIVKKARTTENVPLTLQTSIIFSILSIFYRNYVYCCLYLVVHYP